MVKQENSKVTTRVGEVISIKELKDAYEILVGTEIDGIRLLVQPGTLIMNIDTIEMIQAKDIKVGMSVTVVLNKNTPMTISIPPICSEQVIILANSSNKQIVVGYFDETLTNEAGTLKLNIWGDTVIQNNKGEKRIFAAEDIKNQDAIVVYSVSTRSIPAQTNPEYVMILSVNELKDIEEDRIIEMEETEAGYISARELASTLGYTITWEHDTKTVSLTKANEKLYFTVGKSEYIYKEETRKMREVVKLENNKLFIPKSIFTSLK